MPRGEWLVPAADVSAGAAEVVRLVHAALPAFTWGRRSGGDWIMGPAPLPRRLPEDLSDAEHAGFLVRLAGLLSFLAAHGLGLSAEGARALGARPGSRDVPWLGAAPVPSWRALPAPAVLGVAALRLAGKDVPIGRAGEARRGLEEALDEEGLPARSAEAVAAVLRAVGGARPPDALLLDLARTGAVGERVALDLLGLAVPRELAPLSGERLVSIGGAADWLARGAARRAPGETAFAEAGPPESVEDGAPLVELADALGSDPRAEVLRFLARGETPAAESGPPLVLLARDLDRWDARSLRAWEELPRFLGPLVRIEVRAEAPPPWQAVSLLVPRLGREEISGLVHLPYASPAAFARLWEELASEADGDPVRLLRAARQRARAFLSGPSRTPVPRRAPPVDVVLRAAALLGDGFDLAEAAAVAGAPVERAAEVLDEACDAGTLVRPARSAYRFSDEALRRRLSGGLTPPERASGLARLEAAGTDPFRLLLARLAAGGDASDVVAAARRLAEAVRAGRGADAAALLARAPASAPDLGEPLLAARAHASAGRMEDARAAAARVDASVALAEPVDRRVTVARLLARLGEPEKALALLPESGDLPGRLARAELLLRLRREDEAAKLLDAIGPDDGAHGARIHLLRAELHERRQEFGAAEAELRTVATSLESPDGDPGPVDASFTAGYLALGLGRPREARAFFRTARDEARGDPSRRADALYDLSVAAAEDGALAEAEASLEEALALFSSLGERDRYLSALGQRALLALRRSDGRGAHRDLKTVLAHDRMPGRAFQLLFSIPIRQRLALAEGDDGDAAEAFADAVSRFEECPGHPARREVLVLEGARLLAAGLAAEALAKLEEAEPWTDARSGVEPLRARLVASARRDLGRSAPLPPGLDGAERALLAAEERLSQGLAPSPSARQALAELLERPEGPLEIATRLLEWRGRFPSHFSTDDSAPLRDLALRAARRAGLDGAASRFPVPAAASLSGVRPEAPADPSLVAEDAATREVFETIRRVAPHRISVLVLGESGTGKELVARELHRASGRTGPFVAVNVAALPEALAEAELFGFVRGAFTGADRDRAGVLEASSGGTFFLDEIGDLAPQVQAKLLRVLQEREVRRLGETRTRAVDLRLVAATHRDLARLVEEGRFRGDLLYRIAGITVSLPPLRERPRDLRVLLDRALSGTQVTPEARATLLSWGWPGNVRELLSAVEAARALAGPAGRVEKDHLPARLRASREAPSAGKGRYREAVDEAKRRVILETLAATGGNRTHAAALLGLSRQSLLYELKRLAITD